ncbi:hypothetical protein F9L16_21370 [Agarivorans sp. B2Z047]|uniref:hypothetical protein n=1 Tax=Agarivorans sp. B2Z047 TaxID=2652721 RepID=UPI00128D1475|nr:hypothetical protein [Agarivorans sp. B2Z047]MPW31529.1 hypothetical protein [Agarivorans sp. B2Z047]UQN42572.1 hypothetical protein LQZ07_22800 [Agarivorans sp. B2Z047]
MTNLQLFLQIITWSFLLYLHLRMIKISQVNELKSDVLNQVSDLSSWFERQSERVGDDFIYLEQIYSNKLTSIELLAKQLNSVSRSNLAKIDCFVALRLIDIEPKSKYFLKGPHFDGVERSINIASMDLVDSINTAYFEVFSKPNFLFRLFHERLIEIKALIFSGVLLLVYFNLFLLWKNAL